MIPFDTSMDFSSILISRFKQYVMSKSAFIKYIGLQDYIVYDDKNQEVFWLNFAKKETSPYEPCQHLLQRIVTQYTTHYAASFNPKDISDLVAVVESAYKQQLENESNNQAIKERNERRANEIAQKKHPLMDFVYSEEFVRQ